MCIKLIAIDMDGSMLNSKAEISIKNLEVIKKAMNQGILIVPATGRTISEIRPLKNIDYFSYSICANGACIWDLNNKKIIYSNLIPLEKVKKLFDLLNEFECLLEIYLNGEIYVQKQNFYNFETFNIPYEHTNLFKQSRTPIENLYSYISKSDFNVEKINIFPKYPISYNEIWNKLNEFNDIHITTSGFGEIEVNNKSANKADGLLNLANFLNIPNKNIMAIGDSLNDIEMLTMAHISVAMGNAKKKIKDVAKFSTLTNNEDGVAIAIEKFALSK